MSNVFRRAYVVLCGLQLGAVVLQFYFAAFGVFTHPESDSQYFLHQVNGWLAIPLLSLLAAVAAVLARVPGRLVGLSLLPIGLIFVQTVLFVFAGLAGATRERSNLASQLILGLHAVNGLAVLAISVFLVRRAWAHVRATDAAPESGTAGFPDVRPPR